MKQNIIMTADKYDKHENILNLPQQINFQATTAGGYKTWHSIHNIYDAAGKKLGTNYTTETASVISSGTSTGGISRLDSYRRYLDNMVYENDTLSKIIIPEGYVSKEKNNTFAYHYYIKDYLGNNRLVVTPIGKVEQVNHYYPFGALSGNSTNTSVQSYKYGGKELERMHGLDWYDFIGRSQDPVVGRFWTIDPKCEKSYPISPYAYCRNNPLSRIDPDGNMDWEVFGRGALTATGGVLSIFSGVGVTGTGIGAVAGAALIIEGIGSTAFGITQMVMGGLSDPSDKAKADAAKMPSSISDIGGIVADKAVGNQNGEIRTVVQGAAIIGGVSAGLMIKNTPSSIDWGSNGVSFVQGIIWKIENNNSNK